jgi:hypothetical protein
MGTGAKTVECCLQYGFDVAGFAADRGDGDDQFENLFKS